MWKASLALLLGVHLNSPHSRLFCTFFFQLAFNLYIVFDLFQGFLHLMFHFSRLFVIFPNAFNYYFFCCIFLNFPFPPNFNHFPTFFLSSPFFALFACFVPFAHMILFFALRFVHIFFIFPLVFSLFSRFFSVYSH